MARLRPSSRRPRSRQPRPGAASHHGESLARAAAALGVALTGDAAARLLALLDELTRWNRHYNLTAIAPRDMVTHHLLDSLAVHPDLSGEHIADAGTGAGFPGVPLALANPQKHFTLIDSSAKKLRFVTHAARQLGLGNVTALHARVEALKPAAPFDTVVARAFAPLPRMLALIAPLCGPGTHVLAMKGRWPEAELGSLPPGWRVAAARTLAIPHLAAARCVITLVQRPGPG